MAHSPMLESRDISEADFGVVDPRMAAEVISLAFLQCILRGLQISPAIVSDAALCGTTDVWSRNVSCLVIPDGCIGLPTLAALSNGIPVVAVRNNANKMLNDLRSLPWRADQLFIVENYLEAAGLVAALRSGISPDAVERPLSSVHVSRVLDAHHSRALRLTSD